MGRFSDVIRILEFFILWASIMIGVMIICHRMDKRMDRFDKLHEIFIDLLKHKKKA